MAGTRTYEWDANNKLIAVKEGSSTLASFTYDSDGRRLTKTAGDVTTTYVYDGPQFLEERPTSERRSGTVHMDDLRSFYTTDGINRAIKTEGVRSPEECKMANGRCLEKIRGFVADGLLYTKDRQDYPQ